jgi:hypothetical protein
MGQRQSINIRELNDKLCELEIKNLNLQKELNAAKNIIQMQEKEEIVRESKHSCSTLKTPIIRTTEVSKTQLNLHIDKLLANSKSNISWLPDFVERKLYQNIFGLILNVLDEL